jgi:hypothetical protein
MPSITLSQMLTRIRRRLEDTGSNPHWPDSEIVDYVNESRRDLYDIIYSQNPWVLPVIERDVTWVTSTISTSLDSILPPAGDKPKEFDILLVRIYPDATKDFEISSGKTQDVDNNPVPIHRLNFEELYRRQGGVSRFYDDYQYLDYTQETPAYVSGFWTAGSSSAPMSYHWATRYDEQNLLKMYLSPVPRVDLKLNILYLVPFDDLSTALTSEPVFPSNNVFSRFVDIVEYGAVIKAKGRSDEVADPNLMAYQQRLGLLIQWLDARGRTGTPRVVVDGY